MYITKVDFPIIGFVTWNFPLCSSFNDTPVFKFLMIWSILSWSKWGNLYRKWTELHIFGLDITGISLIMFMKIESMVLYQFLARFMKTHFFFPPSFLLVLLCVGNQLQSIGEDLYTKTQLSRKTWCIYTFRTKK